MRNGLPHDDVFVRLGASPIHGIGVFAEKPIKAGTNIFANDQRDISWVPNSLLTDGSLDAFQRRFYKDFAIRRGDQLGCPSNFNLLTVGWYVNEPARGAQPNLVTNGSFELLASRDIEAGEELTVLYCSFNWPGDS